MDKKLEIKLTAHTRAKIRNAYESEGISMFNLKFTQTDIDDLSGIISPFLTDPEDDDEYDRLTESALDFCRSEFDHIMAQVKKAHSIIQTTLGV